MGFSVSPSPQVPPTLPCLQQPSTSNRLCLHSSASPSYVYLGPYGYIFRLRIPLDLRGIIGKTEYRYSLRTASLKDARHRARLLALNIQQFFIDVRGANHGHARDVMLDSQAIDHHVKMYVKSVVHPTERTRISLFDSISPVLLVSSQVNLEEATTPQQPANWQQTLPAQQPAQPVHALPSQDASKRAQDPQEQQEQETPGSEGTPLSAFVQIYMAEMVKGGNWTEKTYAENKTIFALFIRAMGDLSIESIDRKMVSQYKGILGQLPPNLNMLPQYKGKSIQEVIDSRPKKTLAVNSINKHIHWLSGLFNYAVINGYMPYNPASGMLMKNPKRADQQREVYTQEDLIKLFRSDEHRQATNHEYWVPLIALYSGCRLEEICQLHLEDIRQAKPVGQESGVWVFDINGKHEKRLKNLSSTRLVPIHPRLTELGLLEYADNLRAKREQRLFPFLHQRRDGYGQVVSKWFGRFRKRCGIEEGKTFHSFRHTFITHLKHKQVDPFMIHELDGHAIGSETMGRYGKRYTPEILYREAILKIDYSLDCLNGL